MFFVFVSLKVKINEKKFYKLFDFLFAYKSGKSNRDYACRITIFVIFHLKKKHIILVRNRSDLESSETENKLHFLIVM